MLGHAGGGIISSPNPAWPHSFKRFSATSNPITTTSRAPKLGTTTALLGQLVRRNVGGGRHQTFLAIIGRQMSQGQKQQNHLFKHFERWVMNPAILEIWRRGTKK